MKEDTMDSLVHACFSIFVFCVNNNKKSDGCYSSLCFFGRATWLAKSQFPDLGLNWATAVKALKPKHRPLGNSLLILNLYYLSCLIFVSIFKV